MARKPRSDSKLDKLPPETRQELIDMFVHQNAGLTEVREWLAGLKEPVSISLSGLHSWHAREVEPLKEEIKEQYAKEAQAVASEALGRKVDYTKAIEVEMAQQAYELLRSGLGRKDALAYASTVLDGEAEREKFKLAEERLKQSDQKIKQDGRRLKILEEKHAAAMQAKRKLEEVAKRGADGGLTPETLEEIEQAIGLL